jgi:hypothetical protein
MGEAVEKIDIKHLLETLFQNFITGFDTYKKVYPKAWLPSHSDKNIQAEITLKADSILFEYEWERPACQRGCCGMEITYESLELPIKAIESPDTWVVEEQLAKKQAEYKAKKDKEQKAANEAKFKLEKERQSQEEKRQAELQTLAELKAKYEPQF